jgi:hypothetical protein
VAMNLNQLAIGVFMGCFLVILGLVPGLLYWININSSRSGNRFLRVYWMLPDGSECLPTGYPGRFGSRDWVLR